MKFPPASKKESRQLILDDLRAGFEDANAFVKHVGYEYYLLEKLSRTYGKFEKMGVSVSLFEHLEEQPVREYSIMELENAWISAVEKLGEVAQRTEKHLGETAQEEDDLPF